MNAKQRKAQHAKRRRHQAATRAPSGQGAAAGRPPGAQAPQRGKTAPTKRRLRTVHDMARAARGRGDVERAWRRAFKGVHSIGYKAGGAPSSTGGLQKMTPSHPEGRAPNHRSGSQKRKQRGHRRILDRQVHDRVESLAHLSASFGWSEAMRRTGHAELRPGLWSRDLDRIMAWVFDEKHVGKHVGKLAP